MRNKGGWCYEQGGYSAWSTILGEELINMFHPVNACNW